MWIPRHVTGRYWVREDLNVSVRVAQRLVCTTVDNATTIAVT
jgi:hypothetical protein